MIPILVLAIPFVMAALLLMAVGLGCDVNRLVRQHREQTARDREAYGPWGVAQGVTVHFGDVTDVVA